MRSNTNVPPVIVSGYSDDIVYVRARGEAIELYPPMGPHHIALLPCGLLLKVEYDGDWTFRFDERLPESVSATIEPAHTHDIDVAHDYSDVVVISEGQVDTAAIVTEVGRLD